MKKLFSLLFLQCLMIPSIAFSQSVSPGATVSIQYILTVDGQVIDQSTDDELLQFTIGEPTIIPGLQEEITGMEKGQKKAFRVSPDKAYGPYYEDAIVEIAKTQLPAEGIAVGNFYGSMDSDGNAIQGKVIEILSDVVVMDFNHPLAGKNLDFEVQIVEVA